MIHLRSLQLTLGDDLPSDYPFDLPVLTDLNRLTFHSPVTFFVGENGTGKSTLLEAMAVRAGSIAVGGEDLDRDHTLESARRLAAHLTVSWNKRTHRGFFLRAEDFFNFGERMARLTRELNDLSAGYGERFSGYGLALARGSAEAQRQALLEKYGENLNTRSHGESFLHLFRARFVAGGLYLLDEPDTALSPQRQLALIALLKQMIGEDAQFIIATHSPILMGFPQAAIMSFDGGSIREIPYQDVEQVSLTRSFLTDPDAFVRFL